jgi:hypothetical protein
MKANYLAFVFLAFCAASLSAQKASFFYEPDPISSKQFWREYQQYSASKSNIPLTFSSESGANCTFDGFGFRGQPQFLCTCNNLDAAKTIATNKLWLGGSLGLNLSGIGLNKLAVWDGGSARTSHIELVGRVVVVDTPSAISSHATAVIGNMVASGLNPNIRGMSYQSQLRNWNFTNDNAEIIGAAPNLFLSNHSYASTTAWTYIGGNLYWYGDSTLNRLKDWKFGYYDNRSRIWDSVMVQNPYYLMVKAGGNDRGSGVAPGTLHYYWKDTAWALSTATRDTVGPYDCISTFGNAKNILTIGAVQVIPNGYAGPSSINMLSYSSWGPTDDGRIKPDLVGASGVIMSVGSANDSAYAGLGGTSMAAPNVCGSLLLLQQYHHQLKGTYMRNASLKGLAIHTADRCKVNPGPDYECGWGLPNMAKAALCLKDSIKNSIFEASLNNNDSFLKEVYVTSGDSLRVTLCWTDPKGITGAPAYNDTTPKLVNDLDIRLTNMAGNTLAFPFILNPASPSLAATTGDNKRDNVEQIYTTALPTGRYKIKVNHKGQLQNQQAQPFSLLISGAPIYSLALPVKWLSISAVQTNWNEAKISWSTTSELNNKAFIIEYSLDGNTFLVAGKIAITNPNKLGLNQYQFAHKLNSGLPETIYYRIKQEDIDGNFSYSKTISLQNSNPWYIGSVYPNPFNTNFWVNISTQPNSQNTFEVYNITGKLLFSETKITSGSQTISIDLSAYQQGVYLLKIVESGSNNSCILKIIKN